MRSITLVSVCFLIREHDYPDYLLAKTADRWRSRACQATALIPRTQIVHYFIEFKSIQQTHLYRIHLAASFLDCYNSRRQAPVPPIRKALSVSMAYHRYVYQAHFKRSSTRVAPVFMQELAFRRPGRLLLRSVSSSVAVVPTWPDTPHKRMSKYATKQGSSIGQRTTCRQE